MRVIRGRGATVHRDREITNELTSDVAENDDPFLRVWQPHRQVVFGRRDSNHPEYHRARAIAEEHGFTPVERAVGGHAVCYTGTTVSFVRATPVDDPRSGIPQRYDRTIEQVDSALDRLGVAATRGEPDGSFCPGTHSLSLEGKIVGIAQRVRKNVAIVGGIVVVHDHRKIADVLAPIYDMLDISFERNTTGSIARAGGETDAQRVISVLEESLSSGEQTVEQVRET